MTGAELQQARIALGLSSSQLGGRIGVSGTMIRKWEGGRWRDREIPRPRRAAAALELGPYDPERDGRRRGRPIIHTDAELLALLERAYQELPPGPYRRRHAINRVRGNRGRKERLLRPRHPEEH